MVGHHGWREGVAGRSNQDAGKLGEEEVRVGLDGIVKATLAEAEEVGVLLGCWLLDSQWTMSKKDRVCLPYSRARRHSTAGRRGSEEDHCFHW